MNAEQWCLPPSQVAMYQADGTCAWVKAWVELISYTSSIVTCHSLLFIPYVKYVVKYTAALRAAALRNAFLYPYPLICLHSYNIYLSSSGFPPKNIIKIFFSSTKTSIWFLIYSFDRKERLIFLCDLRSGTSYQWLTEVNDSMLPSYQHRLRAPEIPTSLENAWK